MSSRLTAAVAVAALTAVSGACTRPLPNPPTPTSTTVVDPATEVRTIATLDGLTAATATAGSGWAAVELDGGRVAVVELDTGELTDAVAGHAASVSADGRHVAHLTDDDTVAVLDRDTGATDTPPRHSRALSAPSLSADGNQLTWVACTAGCDTDTPGAAVVLWDRNRGEVTELDSAGAARVTGASISADGSSVTYTGTTDDEHTVTQWRADTGAIVIAAGPGEADQLTVSADGSRVAYRTRTGGAGRVSTDIAVWSAAPFEIQPAFGGTNWAQPVLSADGERLYIVNGDTLDDEGEPSGGHLWVYDLDGSSTIRYELSGVHLISELAGERLEVAFWVRDGNTATIQAWAPR